MKKLFVILATIAFFALPALVPHIVHASGSTTVTLYNPLGSSDEDSDIRIILGRVIKGFLSIIGSIALLMFVYGGTLWLTSAGNPEFIKKGKDIIVWSILGLGVIFSAYAITNALLNALTTGSATG
ncbi:MAG: pilin [Patescibacteria group bacterium]